MIQIGKKINRSARERHKINIREWYVLYKNCLIRHNYMYTWNFAVNKVWGNNNFFGPAFCDAPCSVRTVIFFIRGTEKWRGRKYRWWAQYKHNMQLIKELIKKQLIINVVVATLEMVRINKSLIFGMLLLFFIKY